MTSSITCYFQVSWIGWITGVSVSKEKPPIELLSLGGSFSRVVVLGVLHGGQHREFGVLLMSKLKGNLSLVDCGCVWQHSQELIMTELGLGLGRF